MAVVIIDTITTIEEVMLLQGRNMNTKTTTGGKRKYSDDEISTNINNVVRFVYGNSDEDLNAYLQLFCINTLSVIALNNIMHDRDDLENWDYIDPFDKDRFYDMIEQKKADDSGIDVIPLYRNQNLPRYS